MFKLAKSGFGVDMFNFTSKGPRLETDHSTLWLFHLWRQSDQVFWLKLHYFSSAINTKHVSMWKSCKYNLWWASDPFRPCQRWSRAPSEKFRFKKDLFLFGWVGLLIISNHSDNNNNKFVFWNLNRDLHCVKGVFHRQHIVAGRIGGWIDVATISL